jgi:hypothetical protein
VEGVTGSESSRLFRLVRRPKHFAVSLEHCRFLPTGRAYLTFASRDFVIPAANALRNASIASIPIRAIPCLPPDEMLRTRGTDGRERAAERGIIQGNGLHGGVGRGGTNVVLWGLPGTLTEQGLKSSLVHFQLIGTAGGKRDIYKIEKCVYSFPYSDLADVSCHRPDFVFSALSRFLVRTVSISEAHRLVRYLHMVHFRPDIFQDKYLVRARIVY